MIFSQVDMDSELSKHRVLAEKLKEHGVVRDTVEYLADQLQQGKRLLVEGANGALLDIDFGTYPFVTSSNCSIGGAITGLYLIMALTF